MSKMSRVFRKFVHGASVAFTGSHSLQLATRRWRESLVVLASEAQDLSRAFRQLHIHYGSDTRTVMVGLIDGRRFASLLRNARSAEALEAATGSRLSNAARRVFRRLDDSTLSAFPDAALTRRAEYLSNARASSVRSGALREGEFVTDANRLEIIVRADSELLGRTNKLTKSASRTKRLMYLGGAIAVTGVTVTVLCRVAAEHSARNTGCFMYTKSGANVTKCRVGGCSCPLQPDDARLHTLCSENSIWSKMSVRESACGSENDEEIHCIHCDWKETDVESINYVDREYLPENAYVVCERQDAFDALNELIGGTVENAWNASRGIVGGASDGLAAVLSYLPYVIFVAAFIVVASIAVYAVRVFRPSRD